MGYKGNIAPFIELVVNKVLKNLSNRDFIQFDEKYIKAIILTYLSIQDIFIPISEVEVGGGYSDIILIPDFRFKDVEYGYIVELKYVKEKDKDNIKMTEDKKKEAIEQINKYSEDYRVKKYLKDIKTIKLVVLMKGKIDYELIFVE